MPAQQPSDSTNVSQPGSASASSSSATGSTTPSQPGSGHATTTGTVAELDNLIEVTSPLIGGHASSPLKIAGQARGAWYFEASAPVMLLDAKGKVLAQSHVTAQGSWMTEEFVPFTASLTFTKQQPGSTGTLVLQNDNPSGDPERQKELRIPVTF